MKTQAAKIIQEFGPFPGVENIGGVTFDGARVWFASGERLNGFDPQKGNVDQVFELPARAGTAFDGRHLYQTAQGRIQKIDPETGAILASIPAPSADDSSGLAWAEGSLWVGQYSGRKIHQIDPETGAILKTIESNRFVTGVTWLDGSLWHGTWEDKQSELRRIDVKTGEVLQSAHMPHDTIISGLESDGANRFFCGGGTSAKIRVLERPSA